MDLFSQYAALTFYGNTAQQYLLTLTYLIAAYIVFKLVISLLMKRMEVLAGKTKTKIDDVAIEMFRKIEWLIYLLIVTFFVDSTLQFGERYELWIDNVYALLLVYLGIRAINTWVIFGTEKMVSKRDQGHQSIRIVASFIKISVWTFGFIFLLSLFGYNITSLIAGLGIGGIAIALAIQNVLGDLFSSLSIFVDKPYVEGDFIVVGDKMGTVNRIGLKTTRIVSMAGEELVISNNNMTGRDIQNFGRVKRRRGVVNIGVTYDTQAKQMEEIPEMVRKICNAYEDTEFDRGHFTDFGDFSKNFEFVFFVETKDYAYFLDRNQAILLNIQRAFEKAKIEFAFPTQTLHVKR